MSVKALPSVVTPDKHQRDALTLATGAVASLVLIGTSLTALNKNVIGFRAWPGTSHRPTPSAVLPEAALPQPPSTFAFVGPTGAPNTATVRAGLLGSPSFGVAPAGRTPGVGTRTTAGERIGPPAPGATTPAPAAPAPQAPPAAVTPTTAAAEPPTNTPVANTPVATAPPATAPADAPATKAQRKGEQKAEKAAEKAPVAAPVKNTEEPVRAVAAPQPARTAAKASGKPKRRDEAPKARARSMAKRSNRAAPVAVPPPPAQAEPAPEAPAETGPPAEHDNGQGTGRPDKADKADKGPKGDNGQGHGPS